MSSVTTAQNVKTTIKPVDTKIQDDHANNNQANQPNINLIRNPKSKTVLIFYSQKTINTLVKSQYSFDTSRILFKSEITMNYKYSITSKYPAIAQTYQISIHVDYMFSTC